MLKPDARRFVAADAASDPRPSEVVDSRAVGRVIWSRRRAMTTVIVFEVGRELRLDRSWRLMPALAKARPTLTSQAILSLAYGRIWDATLLVAAT